MGYRFSPTFVQNLLGKYDPRTRKLTLDNFIVACVQIKRLTGTFLPLPVSSYRFCHAVSACQCTIYHCISGSMMTQPNMGITRGTPSVATLVVVISDGVAIWVAMRFFRVTYNSEKKKP